MNLEDLIDENGVQQDEWSLGKHVFGGDDQLQVVGWSGHYYTPSRATHHGNAYIVRCEMCATDHELFGEGYFRSPKASLNKGQIPCGCARFVKWSDAQYRILCTRASAKSGNTFVDFRGSPVNRDTLLIQSCPKHGEWDSGKMGNLLTKFTGCPSCKAVLNSQRCAVDYLIDEQSLLDRFISALPETLKFTGWVGAFKGTKTVSLIYCTKHEIYTEALTSNFIDGRKAVICPRCISENISEVNGLSEDEAIARAEMLAGSNTTVFKGFVGDYESVSTSKIKVMCTTHGLTSTRNFNGLSRAAHPCPICAIGGSSQVYAYINTVVQYDTPLAVKFGITGKHINRLRQQNWSNSLLMEPLSLFKFPSREDCLAAELECKRELLCGVVSKQEMPDGYTETTYIYNVDRIIQIYKKHKGVLI